MNTMIKNPDESQVQRLLTDCDLPTSDITPAHLEHFFGLEDGSALFGIIGLELYGDVALLRSLAVSPEHRSAGLGKQLVSHAEGYALSQGVQDVYLLTTTADKFFSKLGYSSVPRHQAPAAIQGTAEFSDLCPSSSIFMVKQLAS